MKKLVILLVTVSILQFNLFSQEIGLTEFYQNDRLFFGRFGTSLTYAQNFNNIFTTEFEYGNQYINQNYTTSNFENTSKVHAKVFMNNISINFLLSIVNNKKFSLQIGSKPSLFYIHGKEYVNQTYLEYVNDSTFIPTEKYFTRNPSKQYYSYSNELKIKFKEVVIPNISININLSAGYILNGARISGCVISFTDIWAPYGRIGLGVSYKFKN